MGTIKGMKLHRRLGSYLFTALLARNETTGQEQAETLKKGRRRPLPTYRLFHYGDAPPETELGGAHPFQFVAFESAKHLTPQPIAGCFLAEAGQEKALHESVGMLLADVNNRLCDRPLLLLLGGDHVPNGLADRLNNTYKAHPIEVVRLFALPESVRMVMGGDLSGYWLKKLRLFFAGQSVISLICRLAEADEAAYQHHRYLLWKQSFFFRMADRCDRLGIRQEVVAQALGLDSRIGHGWVDQSPADCWGDGDDVNQWLAEQIGRLFAQDDIERVAVWADQVQAERLAEWLKPYPHLEEVRWYVPVPSSNTPNPNKLFDRWRIYQDPLDTLQAADLLVIVRSDRRINELDLGEIPVRMRIPYIVDRYCCYPFQEVRSYPIHYWQLGQKANVWNETDYNRV